MSGPQTAVAAFLSVRHGELERGQKEVAGHLWASDVFDRTVTAVTDLSEARAATAVAQNIDKIVQVQTEMSAPCTATATPP